MPKHMFEIYLRQRELAYSAGGKLTKNNERIEKFKRDRRFIQKPRQDIFIKTN